LHGLQEHADPFRRYISLDEILPPSDKRLWFDFQLD